MDIANNDDFLNENPIDFTFTDNDGNQAIYILDETHSGKTHHLTIRNESDRDLVFRELQPFVISPEENRYHLELVFPAGALEQNNLNWITVQNSGWKMTRVDHPDDGGISLYLLFNSEFIIAADGILLLTFHNVKAGPEGGSRELNVELSYKNVHFEDEETDLDKHAVETVAVVNEKGSGTQPFIVEFLEGGRVLNDSDEDNPNELTLQFTNRLSEDTIELLSDQGDQSPSQFILTLEANKNIPDGWGLGTDDEIDNLNIEVVIKGGDNTSWKVDKNSLSKSTEWTLTPQVNLELGLDDYFRVILPEVISSIPSGLTRFQISYRNIPGYRDAALERIVEKSPLIFKDQEEGGQYSGKSFVGIGTNIPTTELEVDGTITATEEINTPVLKTDSLQTMGGVEGFMVPRGAIIMWSGKIDDIPEGWALCDGRDNPDANSSIVIPDLTDSFILSVANESENPSSTSSGAHSKNIELSHLPDHTHDISHSHNISESVLTSGTIFNSVSGSGSAGGLKGTTGANASPVTASVTVPAKTVDHNGESGDITRNGGQSAFDVRPKHFKLAFIIKT